MIFNGASGNIQGNLDRYGVVIFIIMFHVFFTIIMNDQFLVGLTAADNMVLQHQVISIHAADSVNVVNTHIKNRCFHSMRTRLGLKKSHRRIMIWLFQGYHDISLQVNSIKIKFWSVSLLMITCFLAVPGCQQIRYLI